VQGKQEKLESEKGYKNSEKVFLNNGKISIFLFVVKVLFRQ
jgi:hypothetical protein